MQPDWSGCCNTSLPSVPLPPTQGPPGPPGPEGPQGPEGPPGPGSSCPVYCGTGEPEGVQTSIVGGLFLQTDRAATSHPYFAKRTGTGNTGWFGWMGLRGAGAGSFSIGDNSSATGIDSIAFGENTTASGLRASAIGKSSVASGIDAKAWGAGAVASGNTSIAIGPDTLAAAVDSIAIGRGARVDTPDGLNSMAIGTLMVIRHDGQDVIGIGAEPVKEIPYGVISIGNYQDLFPGTGTQYNLTWGTIAIGHFIQTLTGHHNGGMILIGDDIVVEATAAFTNQILIGSGTYGGGYENTIVGADSVANPVNSPSAGLHAATYAAGLGLGLDLNGDCIVAVGHDSVVRSDFSSAIGPHARAGKDQTTSDCNAFGRFTTALGHRSLALGNSATVADGHTASIAFGYNALTTAAAQLMVGDDAVNAQILNVHFNGSANPVITLDSAGRATFKGTWAPATTTLVAGTTLDTTHGTVRVDTTVGNLTIDLPAAVSATGRVYTVIKISVDANTVTVDANGAETINGAATKVLTTQYEKVVIQSNGTSWDIIG